MDEILDWLAVVCMVGMVFLAGWVAWHIGQAVVGGAVRLLGMF